MPIVTVPKQCEGCGACCMGWTISAVGGNVPPTMVVHIEGQPVMVTWNGVCVALDPATRRCTIYPDRPTICREFERDDTACFEALHKVQRRFLRESEGRVEAAVREAVEFAKARGFAAEVRFSSIVRPTYEVYLRPLMRGPDVTADALAEGR